MNKLVESESEEPSNSVSVPPVSTPLMQGSNVYVPVERTIDDLTQTAEEQIAQLEASAFGYSPQAFQLVKMKVSSYTSELIAEAAREAKRHNADTVSRSDVESASEHLVAGTGKRSVRHLGTIGGVMLGAALSQLLAFSTVSTITFWSVAVTLVVAMIGMALVAYQIAKD